MPRPLPFSGRFGLPRGCSRRARVSLCSDRIAAIGFGAAALGKRFRLYSVATWPGGRGTPDDGA